MWEGHYLQFMENHTVLSFKEVNCERSHKVPSRAFNSAFDLTKSQKSNSELFRNKHEKISSPLFSFSNFNFFKNFQKHFSSAEFSASLRFIRRQIKLSKYHLNFFQIFISKKSNFIIGIESVSVLIPENQKLGLFRGTTVNCLWQFR